MQRTPTKKDDLLGWKKQLSTENVIKLESDLEDYAWHSVLDNNQLVAVFQIINVLYKYSKNLDIKFAPTVRNERENIADIVIFIYNSILEICENQAIKRIKIHTHDPLMEFIFQELSNNYQKENLIKSVKKYGKWVEITL